MSTPALDVDDLADRVVDVYLSAERRLVELMAAKTRQGLDAPDWAERQLATVLEYRKQAERIASSAAGDAAAAAGESVQTAYTRGQVAAVAELSEALRVPTSDMVGNIDTHAVARLAEDARSLASAPGMGMVAKATAAYQQVTNAALSGTAAGAETRRQGAQRALNDFADRGITGFTDRSGRAWRIDSYTEMAMRTQLMNARLQGHTDRIVQNGRDLVIVSDHPQECALCRPWEGAVLSLSGDVAGTISRPNDLDGTPVTVQVKASLDEARADGLLHPNCRHSYTTFLPGVTDPSFGETADPAGDRARQELRRLERGVRSWKRREAAALDQATARAARARVREWQARVRTHVKTTTAKRQSYREQLTAR